MSTTTPTDPPDDSEPTLKLTLAELRAEHRELDAEIARCEGAATDDELLVRRLKKRKLLIKDRIASLENQLDPDEYA